MILILNRGLEHLTKNGVTPAFGQVPNASAAVPPGGKVPRGGSWGALAAGWRGAHRSPGGAGREEPWVLCRVCCSILRREPAGWLSGQLPGTAAHFLPCTKHLSVQCYKQAVLCRRRDPTVLLSEAAPCCPDTRMVASGDACLQGMSQRPRDWKVRLKARVGGLSAFLLTAHPDYQQHHRNGEARQVPQWQDRNSL